MDLWEEWRSLLTRGLAAPWQEPFIQAGYGMFPLGETIPNQALDRTRKRSASMPGLDMLGCAEYKGAGLWYEPNSSSASEAANDRLSSISPPLLPLNETRSLAATEGCWSGRVKRTGETLFGERVRYVGVQLA